MSYEYSVGQKVYVHDQYNKRMELEEHEVQKIGRKWVHLNKGMRIYVVDNRAYSVGESVRQRRVFLSKEQYESWRMDNLVWDRFVSDVQHWRRPEHITAEAVLKARELLGLPLKDG